MPQTDSSANAARSQALTRAYAMFTFLFAGPPDEHLVRNLTVPTTIERFLDDLSVGMMLYLMPQGEAAPSAVRQPAVQLSAVLHGALSKLGATPISEAVAAMASAYRSLFQDGQEMPGRVANYESAYRQGELPDAVSIALNHLFNQHEYEPRPGLPIDHLANELDFLGYLTVHEMSAWLTKKDPEEAESWLRQSGEFLARHLRSWLPDWAARVREAARAEADRDKGELSGPATGEPAAVGVGTAGVAAAGVAAAGVAAAGVEAGIGTQEAAHQLYASAASLLDLLTAADAARGAPSRSTP